MIAKRIDHKPENDNYRALALYVAGIGEAADKVLSKWTAGCQMDDFYGAMKEVEAVQAKNTRSRKNKTYHLMVSWRPEDEAKLGPEIFQAIEREFAAALGLAEHQRQAGVHQNTEHIHLHVAYNLIHPEKFTRHSPFQDFATLRQVCRAMEEKYGLVVDKGLEEESGPTKPKVSSKVKSIKAQSGRETLFSYVQRHKPELGTALGAATNWTETHAAFLKYGLTLRPTGNGLAIKDRFGKHSVKASDMERSWSKARLEKRFGPFELPTSNLLETVKAIETYNAAPLLKGPETDILYAVFQEEMRQRQAALEAVARENRRRHEEYLASWRKKRQELKKLPMFRRDRKRVEEEMRRRVGEDLNLLREATRAQRQAIRAALPYTTWKAYLKQQASDTRVSENLAYSGQGKLAGQAQVAATGETPLRPNPSLGR